MDVHAGRGEVESDQSSLSSLHTLSLHLELRVALSHMSVRLCVGEIRARDNGTCKFAALAFCFAHERLLISPCMFIHHGIYITLH